MAQAALHHFRGDLTPALDYLLSHDGMVENKWLQEARSSKSFEKRRPVQVDTASLLSNRFLYS